MRLCILNNDTIDPVVAPTYVSYAAMTERLLRDAGYTGQVDVFDTMAGQYPASFDAYDAVLLTGSKADAFSSEPWVVRLREVVTQLLHARKKLVGICFGHQLIACCLGAPVGRAAQGWGVGRTEYEWVGGDWPGLQGRTRLALLASHQDQVQALPEGARLLARSAHCPIAAYALDEQVLCVQPHPEFVPDYSAFLINKRRELYGAARAQQALDALAAGHDGDVFARAIVAFIAPSATKTQASDA